MHDDKAVPVVFFDGYCNLCNTAVLFVLRNESAQTLKFATLQSQFAERMLAAPSKEGEKFNTLILIEDGKEYHRSDAALRISAYLKPPWKYLRYLDFVPQVIRDAVYNFVARHRYFLFGKRKTCMVPTEDISSRFLDD